MGHLDLTLSEGRLLARTRQEYLASMERAKSVVAPFEAEFNQVVADIFSDHKIPQPNVSGFDVKGDAGRVVRIEWNDTVPDKTKEGVA